MEEIFKAIADVAGEQIKDYRKGQAALPKSQIIEAARSGDLDTLKSLLDSGVDGTKALVAAAGSGHYSAVKILVDHAKGLNGGQGEKRLNVNVWYNEITPLLTATWGIHAKIVQLLLDEGADIELSRPGTSTALDIAASQGDEEIVRMLVERGANIEARDSQKDTPLLLASRNGHEEVVKYLLDKGAQIEARDTKGSTALLLAARHDSIPVLHILLDRGANIRACDNQRRSVLHRALEGPDLFSVVPKQEAIVRMLLKHGADPPMKNNKGKTPKQAAFHWWQSDIYDGIKAMLDHGV